MTEESQTAEAMDDDSVEEEIKAVEENPPDKLEDWPGGKAKYKTFGGPEAESGYGEGPTEKLGPADLQHHEDGTVTIEGEEVDNPDDTRAIRSPAARPTPRHRRIPASTPTPRPTTTTTPPRATTTTRTTRTNRGS